MDAQLKQYNKNTFRIAPLDGWRAISVALVIFSHLISNLVISALDEHGRTILIPLLLGCASLGVNIFFVISGYVIASGLIREDARYGGISIYRFYIRRAFRIFPPLLIYILLVIILARMGLIPIEAIGVVATLTFTCNTNLFNCGGWFGGHTWSLSYEEQFYLVIPFLFYILWKSSKYVFFMLPAIISLMTLLTYPFSDAAAGFLSHFISIATGVAWACREQDILYLCRIIQKWAAIFAPLLFIAAMRVGNSSYWPLSHLITPIIITFILVYSVFISFPIARLLSTVWLTYIGRISYSIYLWQQLATFAFPGAGLCFYIFSVTLCLFCAWASYKWIESPLISFSQRM
jgi:peptidoglycan/LPS O-acetylase OafA/YrhL